MHREAEEAVWRTLSYVDGVNFARRATAPAHFGVGLRDTVCPPRTAFAAYNHYGAANGRPVRPHGRCTSTRSTATRAARPSTSGGSCAGSTRCSNPDRWRGSDR